MLQPNLTTVIFQIVNFVALLAILSYFVFRPLRERLAERRRTISETLQSAQDQESEAARLREDWETRRAQVEMQAEEIIHAAQVEAEQQTERVMEQARVRLDEITEEIREDLIRRREEVLARHYDDVLNTIIALSGNVVQSVTTRRTHDDLVTNFCASIYQMPQDDVEEYRRAMGGRVPTAFVTTPVALTEEQNKTVADTLSSLVDHRVELQVTVDPALIAGIQVRLADRLIDNSIRQQLLRIRDRVRREMVNQMETATAA